MGGLGKTTLARKVYNSDVVKKHFNCRAWVYVSNDCSARELMVGLLKHLMPNAEYADKPGFKYLMPNAEYADKPGYFSRFSDDELKKMVRKCLEGKKYLVVLDDLWKKQDWEEVQNAFPDENRGGSRILITSRHKEVASHTSPDPPFYLQFLAPDVSWDLFSRKAFRGEECPSDLEPLGKQMVKSCGGLPLSIVVLAGLLVNKEKSHREWSKVVGHVNWYLTRDETQVKDIVLKLSYDDLPTRLTPCFLYLGIFPEDSEIHARQLLERWVAEGFIQETGSRDPDDVAEDYLYELIDRSLIQVARVMDGAGVETCRIHDLLRDLCINEGKKEKVFHVCTDNNILIPTKPRRLSIHCTMSRYLSSSTNDHSRVRSLFCFDRPFFGADKEWEWLSKDFKLVRVLDLEGSILIEIPSNLGNFIHLSYLKISAYCKPIPDSICNLQNLQTLDLGYDLGPSLHIRGMLRFMSLPPGIWKLKHLRHVYTYRPIMLSSHHLESDAEIMWNLQTISYIVLDKQMACLVEKGMFPKLRKLGLSIPETYGFNKGDFPKQLLCLQQLRHLNVLKIYFEWSDHPYSLQEIGCKPWEVLQSLEHLNNLSELEIFNPMDLATCAAMFPPNITNLKLSGVNCMNDNGMNALGNLPKLRILSLFGHAGSIVRSFNLNCATGGFPQLQRFEMRDLHVQNWKLANAAMPCLQRLVIVNCKRMDSLPSELWSLTALRKVHVCIPSDEMAVMLQNLQVKNGCELIVEHN